METTNDLITKTIKSVDQLIGYAKADVEGSQEAGARVQAAEDRARVRKLTRAKKLLEESYKPGVRG